VVVKLPVVVPPDAGILVPFKIAHGERVDMDMDTKGGECMDVDGLPLRFLEIESDVFVGNAAARARCVKVRDGQMCASDWKNDSGQIMAFAYWTLGTSNINAKSEENPVQAKSDSRVWFRCFKALSVLAILCTAGCSTANLHTGVVRIDPFASIETFELTSTAPDGSKQTITLKGYNSDSTARARILGDSVGAIIGGAIGTAVAPGVGTAVGAGAGIGLSEIKGLLK
jgi:hypothetical protein